MNFCKFCGDGKKGKHFMWCLKQLNRDEGFPKGERITCHGIGTGSKVYKLTDRRLGLHFARHCLFGSDCMGFSMLGVDLGVSEKGNLFVVQYIYNAKHYCDCIKKEGFHGEVYTIVDEEFRTETRDYLSPVDMLMLGLSKNQFIKVIK